MNRFDGQTPFGRFHTGIEQFTFRPKKELYEVDGGIVEGDILIICKRREDKKVDVVAVQSESENTQLYLDSESLSKIQDEANARLWLAKNWWAKRMLTTSRACESCGCAIEQCEC